MSISMCAKIAPHCVTEHILEEALKSYFIVTNDLQKNYDDRCIVYKNFIENNDVTISFVEKKKPPYNIYDSEILNSEYMYNQAIIFNINKNANIAGIYHTILKFCKYLQSVVHAEILITSDSHGEICLIKMASAILWSESSDFINKDEVV